MVTYSDRANFVTNQYRYVIQEDALVRQVPGTTSIEHLTSVDMAGAAQLASEIIADVKGTPVVHEITVGEIAWKGSDLDGSPPMFQVNLPGYGPRQSAKLTSLVVDWSTFTNVVTVRG